MQVIVGIGAKPVVSPFEAVGLNTTVGGIQVSVPEYSSMLIFLVSSFHFYFLFFWVGVPS